MAIGHRGARAEKVLPLRFSPLLIFIPHSAMSLMISASETSSAFYCRLERRSSLALVCPWPAINRDDAAVEPRPASNISSEEKATTVESVLCNRANRI